MATIYWFSGTGNSYHAARSIGDRIGDTRLVRITDNLRDNGPTAKDDVVGFVFPVYAGGMPVLASELLESAEINADYLFCVATHAGVYGNALRQFERLATGAGQRPDALFDIVMPSNARLKDEPRTPGPKAAAKLEQAEAALESVAARIRDRVTLLEGRGGGLYGLLARLVHPLFSKGIRKADNSFGVNEDCTSCGVCARVCPTSDITFDEQGRPVWHNRCEGCNACISFCPEHAIYKGRNHERRYGYRHPEVSAGYLMRGD
jgi:ferredoxin